MRIAVLSDTHGRIATVEKALGLIAGLDVAHIVHCGDIDDAETVELFPANSHFVFGNCDTDRAGIHSAVEKLGADLHEGFGHLKLAGVDIGFVHGDDPRLFRELENSAAFRFLFYGHTHIAREHQKGPTRVINPGALHRAAVKTFIVVDLATEAIETVVV